MIDFPYITELCNPTPSKIVMLVVDGLGGLPHPDTGKSELETAVTPNLDLLASDSACGLTTPVAPGITPGSGPGHLALFGYDPVKYLIGRGVLEAIGIGVELRNGQVAARGNFCTLTNPACWSTGGQEESPQVRALRWWNCSTGSRSRTSMCPCIPSETTALCSCSAVRDWTSG